VSPVIKFPCVRNHRRIFRDIGDRRAIRKRQRRLGNAREMGRRAIGQTRKRKRKSSEEAKRVGRGTACVAGTAEESNRNRVKCSGVKPCRGMTSITRGGFVTATFSATFQLSLSPLPPPATVQSSRSFPFVSEASEGQATYVTHVMLEREKERFVLPYKL